MATKTDNDFFADKVWLRAEHLPMRQPVRVLDCYGGTGQLWLAVGRISGREIERVAIDMRADIDAAHIHGDNRAIVPQLDLTHFDVIDLDAYGVPIDLLMQVVTRFRGEVFVTFIQTIVGILPMRLFADLGIEAVMVDKCPTLFARRGWQLFLEWLAAKGVTIVNHRSKHRKHYLHFSLSDVAARATG